MTDSLTSDSVYIALNDFKYISKWAEFGFACEKTLIKLQEQIISDGVVIAEVENKYIEAENKNGKLKKLSKALVGVIIAESILIIALIL